MPFVPPRLSDNTTAADRSETGSRWGPRVTMSLYTNLYLGRRSKATQIISVMRQHDDIFVPEWVDIGGEDEFSGKVEFGRNSQRALRLMSARENPGLIAGRDQPVSVSYVVAAHDFLMFDWITVSVDESWFREMENVDRMRAFATALYRVAEASSGHICYDELEQRMDVVEGYVGTTYVSRPVRMGPKRHLPGLFWANLFGPEYVDMWGRRFLATAPCHRVEELPDGGVILYLSESPLDAAKRRYRQAKDRLFRYLGPEAFDGRMEPRFRTKGRWRKKRDARPLVETGGVLDDVFAETSQV